MHGYEMAGSLNELLGPGSKVEPNDLYRKLQSLEDLGLARSTMDDRSVPRKVFYPSERASSAVMEWMSATGPLAVVRAEFYTKVAVAGKEHIPALLEVLVFLERCVKGEIDEIPDEHGSLQSLPDLQLRLVRGSKLDHLRAELNGIVRARSGLREFQ